MSNANSIAGWSQSGTLRNQFPTQTISTAAETQLTITTDAGTAGLFLALPYGASATGAMSSRDTNGNQAVIARSGRMYGRPSGEANAPYSVNSWDGHPIRIRVSGIGNAAAQLATPVNSTFTQANTGGTLLDTTTYYYRVAAINAQGGTSLASTETSQITSGTGGNAHTMTVTWGAVAGATGYKIYGRTTGAEQLIGTVTAPTVQFVDDGSVTPSGALPTAATSGVTIKLYRGTTALTNALATTGTTAIATAGGAFDFFIEAVLMWDNTSQVLSGWYTANIGYGTSSSHFTTTTVVSSVPTGLAVSDLAFAAAATFGFASSANTITVKNFCIDEI